MFGQMLPGSEPRISEDLNWHDNFRFKQTAIFGDIQPWNLIRIWTEQCNGSQKWTEDSVQTQNWIDQNAQSESWSNITNPEIDITRC